MGADTGQVFAALGQCMALVGLTPATGSGS